MESKTTKHRSLYLLLSISVLMMGSAVLVEGIQYRGEVVLCVSAALLCWLAGWILAIAILKQGMRLGVLVWAWLITGSVIFGTFFLLLLAFVLA